MINYHYYNYYYYFYFCNVLKQFLNGNRQLRLWFWNIPRFGPSKRPENVGCRYKKKFFF